MVHALLHYMSILFQVHCSTKQWTYTQLYMYVTNLGTSISHTTKQLSQDMQFVYHYITSKLLCITPMHLSSQHPLFMHTLISALILHNTISCLHVAMKQHLSTQLASQLMGVCTIILYIVASQLVHYESCVVGHLQKYKAVLVSAFSGYLYAI